MMHPSEGIITRPHVGILTPPFNATARILVPVYALLPVGGSATLEISNVVFSNGLLDPWSGLGLLNQTLVSWIQGPRGSLANH